MYLSPSEAQVCIRSCFRAVLISAWQIPDPCIVGLLNLRQLACAETIAEDLKRPQIFLDNAVGIYLMDWKIGRLHTSNRFTTFFAYLQTVKDSSENSSQQFFIYEDKDIRVFSAITLTLPSGETEKQRRFSGAESQRTKMSETPESKIPRLSPDDQKQQIVVSEDEELSPSV